VPPCAGAVDERIQIGIDVVRSPTSLSSRWTAATPAHQVESTPADPSVGHERPAQSAGGRIGVEEVGRVIHALPSRPNAVLERKPTTMACSRRRFRSVLEIGRHTTSRPRKNYYGWVKPTARHADLIFGCASGWITRATPGALDEDHCYNVAARSGHSGRVGAICFLYAFFTPARAPRR